MYWVNFELNECLFWFTRFDALYIHRIIKILGEKMSKEKLYIYMYNIYFKYKACKFECSEKKINYW